MSDFTLDFSSWFTPWIQSAVTLDIMTAASLSSDQIANRQAHRLNHLISTARVHSPYYRDLLQSLPNVSPYNLESLTTVPMMTRHTVMDHFDQWSTDSRVTRNTIRRFISDKANIARDFLDQYIVWESSGTHGEPGYFIQDTQAMAVYDALEGLRRSRSSDVHPLLIGERIAFVGALDGHFASCVSIERLRRLNPWLAQGIQCFSIMQDSVALVDDLNTFKPTVIATYPTAAALLAEQAHAGRLHVRPREVWTGGENLSDAVRHYVEECLNCSVRNSYGASEFLTIGWECHLGKMHVNADWVILEPVDEHLQPVLPGTVPATTLLTNLANHVQPLIRYDIGDRVSIAEEPCLCESPLPVIDVLGRDDDSLKMAGKKQGSSVTVLPLALITALEEDAGVFDFQVFQRDAQTLAIRLPGSDTAQNKQLMERSRKALRQFAATQGLAPIRVVSECNLALVHGSSGKIRRVVAASNIH